MEIGDPTDLEVLIEVLSSDAATLAPGAEVHLDQWGSDKPLLARVRMIEPAAFTKVSALGVEEQRVNVIADLLAPPEARPGLGDRYRVEAHIVVWKTTDTLKVPAGALFRRGTDWVVYALQNGRAQLKKVRVGRSSSTEAQVLDGLAEGEEVLLYPGDRIEEGQRVRPIRIEP
jgi:HlyD family secretion protein